MTFGERHMEHFRDPSTIYDHSNTTGYQPFWKMSSIIGRESHHLERTIKEAIYIRVIDPSLNRNTWDEVLVNTPDLKLK